MKTKTAYRPKNIPAEAPPNIPEEIPQPSESVKIDFAADKAEPAVAIVSADEFPEPDEASEALKRQLEHLHASEALQRQHAAQMAAPAPTLPADREARLSLWREHGLSP